MSVAKENFVRKQRRSVRNEQADDAQAHPRPKRKQGGETAPEEEDIQANTERSLDELASLEDELEKAKDHALRCHAEMENFKKRLSRQVEDERKFACLPIVHDLLPVLDNMDRAIEAAGNSESGAGLLEGFGMVAQLLRGVLTKYDCLEIEALHKPFDPNLHQAVSQLATEEFPANTVVAVVQSGYQLHARVVRPSKVIVSTQPEQQDDVG